MCTRPRLMTTIRKKKGKREREGRGEEREGKE
jgi:hypothetical protein